ncbi:adenine deaminase [Williamwhitmania taraxaci]|uniref:Adenine deaminase n=1 Tax=Williamwhitmania taraxaci TaxID=1640674 RepID=A0A1G6GY19_9BACT|nr:adenine deaminase [Williamwhitmania taraxaci]SDB86824.1 Adenine deaminase [Williamwhitmania taraxaci]
MKLSGNIVDLERSEVYYGALFVEGARVVDVLKEGPERSGERYLCPGFIDSHVHIESSMVSPSRFGAEAVKHGTVAVVTDPHEIANVLGVPGIDFMIEDSKKSQVKFYFGAPSCVPATFFESSGAIIDEGDIARLMARDDIFFLAEMMNFPGVIYNDPRVIKKIEHAKEYGKPIDGHAPGLMGDQLSAYAGAGISTDHECFSMEEARAKMKLGMKILIREGSAAKNFDALHELIAEAPDLVMFCTDDCHPNDFRNGHINLLVKRAIALGYDFFSVLKIACLNPIGHYKLAVGTLKVGDYADFLVLKDLVAFEVVSTYINGVCVTTTEGVLLPLSHTPNNFNCETISLSDIRVEAKSLKVRVIEIEDGELITGSGEGCPTVVDSSLCSNVDADILKIVVVNRYEKATPAIGFIKGLKLSNGAIATTVAHDSHNIICAGVSDEDIVMAINHIIENKGGLCIYDSKELSILPLPIAGLMCDCSVNEAADRYESLEKRTRSLGCTLKSPFMTLSFMALIVIPELKLSDKGLFSTSKFDFVDLFVN